MTVADVLDLWHGTDDDTGYHSEELVVAACQLERPAGPAMAVALFYPGQTLDTVPEEDRDMIESGYRLYLRRLDLPRPRASRSLLERIDGYVR